MCVRSVRIRLTSVITPFVNPLTIMAEGYGFAGPLSAPGAPLGIVIGPVLVNVWVTDPRTGRVTVVNWGVVTGVVTGVVSFFLACFLCGFPFAATVLSL